MNFSALFIHRPIGTTLLTIALALAGAMAYQFLPVSPLPQVEFPTIEVQAALPGASPEIMASAVATPLERQFGRIAGLNEMTSTSFLGFTRISLQFDLSRDINAAARDVQAAINAARGQLPANLPNAPFYRKSNPADSPVVILALVSDIVGRARMYDLAASILQQKLSQVPGVGRVIVSGGSLPAVRVAVNPTVLQSYGLSLEDVRAVLSTANANRPKGEIADNSGQAWSINTTDQLLQAADYKPVIISYRQGAAVRLADVADVVDASEDIRNNGVVNGTPAILLIVWRQPGANILATVDRVRAILPQLQADIPPTVRLINAVDRTTTIRASVHEVQRTLGLSVLLVILVVFVFFRTVRTAIIPSVVVPVSLIGTFGAMYLLGYSVNNLSLMALTIATGFVVDNTIVVENIMRHLEQGMLPRQAALRGAEEIGFTVISITLSLLAVFIPILLMGGIFGRLFREFAVTLAVAVSVSLVVSLTTTPMMCAYLLRAQSAEGHGWLYRTNEWLFQSVLRLYEITLGWVLRLRLLWGLLPLHFLVLLVTLATIAFTVHLYIDIPKGFFPQQDTGQLFGQIQADQSGSFQATRQILQQFVRLVGEDPAVDNVLGFTGGNYGGSVNTARMFIALKPLEERQISVDQVLARLRRKLASVPEARLFMQAFQELRMGGRVSGAQYQFTLQGDNVRELNEWAPRVLSTMRSLPLLTDVNSDQQDRGLEASLVIDRATAARLGISTATIDDTLYDAFGQRQVSTMYKLLNQYHVVLEVGSDFLQNPDGLKHIYVRSASRALVPLSAFTHYAPSNTPLTVNHQGLFPAITLSFNLAPGVALGDAVTAIERATREIGLPAAIHSSFQGTAQAFQDSLESQPMLIAAALVAVYIVLGVLYESYIHPLTILSTLPSAGVGALLALQLYKTDLSIIAMIGIILLIGIVKKNAIMMIDFALEAERREHKSPEAAIFQACVLRFRPIIMTTMAVLLGGLPLVLSTGTGAELRRPLGITIVGGLLFSQLLTLYTTPVVYLYLDRLQLWCTRLYRRRTQGLPAEVYQGHAKRGVEVGD